MAGENSSSVHTRLTGNDVTEIGRRLCQIIDAERAIHRLAVMAIDANGGGDSEAMLLAIREMARSNVKGLDACTMRLSGDTLGAGNFAGEFAME